MKKLLTTFLLLCSLAMFSQTYHFDYFLEKQDHRIKPDSEKWIRNLFYDSSTGSQLFLDVMGKKMVGTIYEKDKNRRHVFHVLQKENRMNFVYKYSNQLSAQQRSENYNKNNVIKIEKLDSLNYKIIAFKNSRQKSKQVSILVTLEKSDIDYIKINADYNRSDEMAKMLKEMLPSDFKCIIKREQINYSSGYVFDNRVANIQKVDLTLKIPEKIIFKEFSYFSDFEE